MLPLRWFLPILAFPIVIAVPAVAPAADGINSPLAKQPEPTLAPPLRTIEINVGERQEAELAGGKKVSVKLLDLKETRDALRNAVRRAEVQVEVDGQKVSLVSANYRLPVTVGAVQIDCPVTKGYRQD